MGQAGGITGHVISAPEAGVETGLYVAGWSTFASKAKFKEPLIQGTPLGQFYKRKPHWTRGLITAATGQTQKALSE